MDHYGLPEQKASNRRYKRDQFHKMFGAANSLSGMPTQDHVKRGEDKTKMISCRAYGEPDRPFTDEDLKAIKENLARLHESSVKRIYREAWQQCEG